MRPRLTRVSTPGNCEYRAIKDASFDLLAPPSYVLGHEGEEDTALYNLSLSSDCILQR